MIRFTLCLTLISGCFPRADMDIKVQQDSSTVETGVPHDSSVPDDTGGDTGVDTAGDTAEETGQDTGWETGTETGDTGPVDTAKPCTETVWYADMDGDGYGNLTLYEWACEQPTGYVSQAGDADDTDASVHWSGCQQTLAGIGLEADLRLEEWGDLTLSVSLSETTQYALVYWYDSAAPRGYWISCGEVSGLTAAMYVDSDTSVTEYYGNTYTEEATGAAEDWNQYLVTSAERSDGTSFEVTAYTTAAELVAVP